ncbi:PAS domain S-box-containing protein [Luteibacter sp. W1I16]|uniref:sensor histidine kinase n=1 Tax=Luteibacter sp. W1I16 TaxID=3373922 RepID=UPI003D2560C5
MSNVEKFPIGQRALTEFEALVAAGPEVLEAIPGAVYLCDSEGWLLSFNAEAAGLWGRTPNLDGTNERFCGSHRLFLLDGTPLRPDECPMADAIRVGTATRNAEVIMERPDGSRFTALVNIRALKDRHGAVQGAINCFQDISTRKAAEDYVGRHVAGFHADAPVTHLHEAELARRNSEQHMRDLLEALPAAVYTTDANGRITFFNKACIEMAGRTPQLGDEWCVTWRLYTSDGVPLPHDQCPMAVALKENRPVRGVEAMAERPDGTFVPFTPYPTPLHDASGKLIGAINMLVDIGERKRAENRQKTLIDELNHRVKNTLAIVQSLAMQTVRHSDDLQDFSQRYESRLIALARAHDLLTTRHWENAPLDFLAREILAPMPDAEKRVHIQGPVVKLNPKEALSLTMALGELATNAAKYGALSSEAGELALSWQVREDADPAMVELIWQERGGPPVQAPTRRGFGSRLMERCVERDLNGKLDLIFEPGGLYCHISIPLRGEALNG